MSWMSLKKRKLIKKLEKRLYNKSPGFDIEEQRKCALRLIEVFVPDVWIPLIGKLRKRAMKEIMKRVKQRKLYFSNLTESSVTIHWK